MFQNSSTWSDLQVFVDKSFSGNFPSVGGRPGAFIMGDHHAHGRPSNEGRPSYVRISFLIRTTLMDELELVQFFSLPSRSIKFDEYIFFFFFFIYFLQFDRFWKKSKGKSFDRYNRVGVFFFFFYRSTVLRAHVSPKPKV